jgi:hypothetical protein
MLIKNQPIQVVVWSIGRQLGRYVLFSFGERAWIHPRQVERLAEGDQGRRKQKR